MTTKFDWSQFTESPEEPKKDGFDWSQFKEEKEDPTFKNWSKEGSNKKPLNEFFDFTELNKQKKEQKEQGRLIREHPFKAAASVGVGIGRGTNAPIELAETLMRKAGLVDEHTTPAFTSQLLDKASEFIQQNISPEDQERLGKFEKGAAWISPSAIVKPVSKVAKHLIKKIPAQVERTAPQVFKNVVDTFESGLTKPRAVEAKHVGKAIITPEMQKKSIQGLEKEAAELTRKSVQKHVPITDEIKSGFDFDKKFSKEYGELNHLAKKHNLEIDITPLNKFLREAGEQYRNIPNPHPEAKSILSEVKGWRKKPVSDLASLNTIYKSNNKKISRIIETPLVSGKQKEYLNFLLGQNKAIEKSIVNYLPKDSYWAKQFQGLNKKYSEHIKGMQTLQNLEPVLGDKINTSVLRKLAYDPKKQKKLALMMGEEGADEIIQISKHLTEAVESINKMTAKEISKFDVAMPLNYLIPGIGHIAGTGAMLCKGSQYARRAYGWYLSKPATRKVYEKSLKAITDHNIPAYKKAIEEFNPSDLQ